MDVESCLAVVICTHTHSHTYPVDDAPLWESLTTAHALMPTHLSTNQRQSGMTIVDLLESGHDASIQSLQTDGAENAHMGYQDPADLLQRREICGGMLICISNQHLLASYHTTSKYARLPSVYMGHKFG